MKNLREYRNEIDELDHEIIQLLDKRFKRSLEMREYKKIKKLTIENKEREEEIKNKILNCKTSEIVKEELLAVYQTIFDSSKKLQK